MRSRSKTTKWNIFFHYSSFLFAFTSGILLVPLYLKYISAEIYGYWLATGNILNWISIVDPGFSMVTQQRVANSFGAKKLDLVGKYALNSILLTSMILVLLTIMGIIFWFFFPTWLGIIDHSIREQLQSAFIYALLGILLSFTSFTIVSVNQGLQSSIGIGSIFIFSNTVSIVFSIWGLVHGYGILTLGLASLIRGGIDLIGNSIYMIFRFFQEKIRATFDKSIMKEILSLVSFNFMGRIGSICNSQIAAFLITKYLNPNDTVTYRFTLTVPETSKLLLVRPAVALFPAITHLLGEGDTEKAKQIFIRLLKYLVWASGIIVSGFVLMNKTFIGLWTDTKYFGGFWLNLVLVLWVIISIFTSTLSNMVFALGNIKKNNIVTFVQAIAYIILVIIGLNFFGLLGAALALLLAEIIVPLVYYPITFSKMVNLDRIYITDLFFELLRVGTISVLIIITMHYVNPFIMSWSAFILWCLFITVTYCVLLIIISKELRKEVLHIFKKN